MKNIKYYGNKEIRKIGVIKKRVFMKSIKEDKHLMRIFGETPGIQKIIDTYLNDFDEIKITTDSGKVFKTTKRNWVSNRFEFEAGHGKQYFMNLKHWEVVEPNITYKSNEQDDEKKEIQGQILF